MTSLVLNNSAALSRAKRCLFEIYVPRLIRFLFYQKQIIIILLLILLQVKSNELYV